MSQRIEPRSENINVTRPISRRPVSIKEEKIHQITHTFF